MRHRNLIAAMIFCFLLFLDIPLFAQATTDYLVNWTPNPEPTVTGYVIYRSLVPDVQSFDEAIDSVDANTHSYLDTGLQVGTVYYYRLIAKDSSDNRSGLSNLVSGVTIPQDANDTAKNACRINNFDQIAEGAYDVGWSTLAATVGFIQYDIDNTLDSASTLNYQFSTSHINRVQNLIGPQLYYMRAVSYNSTNDMIISTVDSVFVSISAQGPLPPQNVAVNETPPDCAEVTWQAGSEPNISGYYVYYGSLSVPNDAPAYTDSVNAGNVTALEICGFNQEGTYYFAVKTYTTDSQYSAYSEEQALTVDRTPPTFTDLYPADGADSVYVNTTVSFVILDSGAGVDTLSVRVRVNGETPSDLFFGGQPNNLLVSCELLNPLPENTDIVVSVTASDQAALANTDSISWTFSTGDLILVDTTPPVVCCQNPPVGAVGVNPGAPISIQVSDDGSGIDFARINMSINYEPVEFTIEGTPQSAVIRCTDHQEFLPSATITVILFVSDRSSPANYVLLDDYTFQVAAGTPLLTSDDPALIIPPDGFWANNPDKPLEVRNLPLNWTIRIFNNAGIQVRGYTNRSIVGLDWSWNDFANDSGNSVARSLYHIRVTDADGVVQRSGRFLVQRDP